MKIVIDYNGERYESMSTTEESAENMAKQINDSVSNLTNLKVDLKDGGYLILGKTAIQSCAILVLND